jgi:GalNAc5-diNAcBac-PP-undecaprenol beta-1,3-glucosyltransferase
MNFTVVIPTFNRERLVQRAIRSVFATSWPGVAVIVVDDASTDGTSIAIAREFPQVQYVRLPQNSGPGVARNIGMSHASSWTVLLDDDDLLRPDSLAVIAHTLAEWPQAHTYPCIQFARANGSLDQSFRVLGLHDYLQNRIRGDFLPVINVPRFLSAGLCFPDVRIGGEHLLWFHVAKEFGIPTWNCCLADLGSEKRAKLCSAASQLARPGEYAEVAEQSLRLFGEDMLTIAPGRYWRYALGAAIYRLLDADPKAALHGTFGLARGPRLAAVSCILMACLVPPPMLRYCFRAYRDRRFQS